MGFTAPLFARHDLSAARRILLAGDIHGTLDPLVSALDEAEYDETKGDRLILLGDILDRGPLVLEIYDWLQRHPQTLLVRGNHDDLLIKSCGLEPHSIYANPYNFMRNGGTWITQFVDGAETNQDAFQILSRGQDLDRLIDARILAFARFLAQSPVAIEARTPGGSTIGLVHGDVPLSSWKAFRRELEAGSVAVAFDAMWQRDRFETAKASRVKKRETANIAIRGIDHVYFGHSITQTVMTCENATWIDTGAYRTGQLALVDPDQIASLVSEAA